MMRIEREERVAGEVEDAALARKGSPNACVASCPTALVRVLRLDMGLAVWQRCLDDVLVAELERLMLDTVDDIMFMSGSDAVDAALAGAMEEGGYPDMPAFRRDVAMLADRHAAVSGDRNVRIRLEVVETDACRKFHADHVTLRTITSYLGQGTQWIDAGIDAASANRADPVGGPAMRQLGTGDVGMFKGRLWQAAPTILHRSPPIAGSGEQRLILAIDPAPMGSTP